MDFTEIIRTSIALGIGLFVGIGMGYIFLPHIKEYLDEKGVEKRKIVELFAIQEKVSADEVAKYLGISLPMAKEELQELEKRGVVRRVKNTGNELIYENTPR